MAVDIVGVMEKSWTTSVPPKGRSMPPPLFPRTVKANVPVPIGAVMVIVVEPVPVMDAGLEVIVAPVGIVGASYGTTSPSADLSGTVASPVVIALSTLATVAQITVATASVAGKRDNFVTQELVGAVTPNVKPHLISPFNPSATLPTFNGVARVHMTWNAGANQGDFKIVRIFECDG